MNGFYRVSEWIMRLSVVNLLWIVFNLPLVLIILNVMQVDQPGVKFFSIIVLTILAPFLFFPATAAMFSSVRDWTLSRDAVSLSKNYWFYYKENYRNSLLGGAVLTLIWFVWAVDSYYFSQANMVLMFSFIALGVILFVFTINFFSVLVHYQINVRSLLKQAFLFTFASPLLSSVISFSSFLIIYVSMNGLQLIVPLFSGTLIAFISFSAFYRFYVKYQSIHSA
ncbi:YesL family protein [Alteribacillus bidgolensis]|nr:DUF624 domain-containing protein [Alteribacillus bidgolensis]